MTFEETITRREALRRVGLLGLSATAGAALLAACSDNKGQAGGVQAPDDTGAGMVTFDGPRGELKGAYAPAATPKGAVLVIHGDHGLTPHFAALPARLAADGYTALAVDLLSEEGGTAKVGDAAQAQQALSAAPRKRLVADLRAGLDELARRAPGAKLAAMGFSFGGGMTWSVLDAPDPRLAAAALYDGALPEGADLSGAKTAVMVIYAGNSPLNAGRPAVEAALLSAGLKHEVKVFLETDDGFSDDTNPHFNQTSADAAHRAVLDWFGLYLA